jgi:hypothetical protein
MTKKGEEENFAEKDNSTSEDHDEQQNSILNYVHRTVDVKFD